MSNEVPLIDLPMGTLVKSMWSVSRRLGEGGCGVIYEVINIHDTGEQGTSTTRDKAKSERKKTLFGSLRRSSAAHGGAKHEAAGGGADAASGAKRTVMSRSAQSPRSKLPPRAALKAEVAAGNKDDEVLKMEVHVMKRLQHSKHVVKLYTCGRDQQRNFNYIVMELLGANLGDLRRDCPDQKFTQSTSIRLAIQCLQAIQDVHEANFVHRDIKPSNFALGGMPETKRIVYILDFGLTRSYRILDTSAGRAGHNKWVTRKPRTNVAFRGTIRYCSLNVHRRLEQGRHDDLWSLGYMLIEFITGSLPWRMADTERTMQLKETVARSALTAGCPKQVNDYLVTLRPYTYASEPEYTKLRKLLLKALKELAATASEPFDWELGGRYYDHFRTNMAAAARARPQPACDVTEKTANANDTDASTDEVEQTAADQQAKKAEKRKTK